MRYSVDFKFFYFEWLFLFIRAFSSTLPPRDDDDDDDIEVTKTFAAILDIIIAVHKNHEL